MDPTTFRVPPSPLMRTELAFTFPGILKSLRASLEMIQADDPVSRKDRHIDPLTLCFNTGALWKCEFGLEGSPKHAMAKLLKT